MMWRKAHCSTRAGEDGRLITKMPNKGILNIVVATHVVSQAVSLVGHGQSGELPQSQLALHGLVCAHDEGLPRGGRESQCLDWEEKINTCNKHTLRFCKVRSSVEY